MSRLAQKASDARAGTPTQPSPRPTHAARRAARPSSRLSSLAVNNEARGFAADAREEHRGVRPGDERQLDPGGADVLFRSTSAERGRPRRWRTGPAGGCTARPAADSRAGVSGPCFLAPEAPLGAAGGHGRRGLAAAGRGARREGAGDLARGLGRRRRPGGPGGAGGQVRTALSTPARCVLLVRRLRLQGPGRPREWHGHAGAALHRGG